MGVIKVWTRRGASNFPLVVNERDNNYLESELGRQKVVKRRRKGEKGKRGKEPREERKRENVKSKKKRNETFFTRPMS